MIRSVGAEVRKSCTPTGLFLVLLVVAATWTSAKVTTDYARLQVPVAVSSTVHDPAVACAAGDAAACQGQSVEFAQRQARLDEQFASDGRQLGAVTNSLRTWPGALRFSVHQLVTGVGWLFLVLLAGVHVAGEWRSGSAAPTVLAVGGLRRYFVAKAVSMAVVMSAVTVIVTAALVLTRAALGSPVGKPSPLLQSGPLTAWHLTPVAASSAWSSWGGASLAWVCALGVWLLMAGAVTGVAVLVRKPLFSVAAGIAGLSAGLVLIRDAHLGGFTIFPLLGKLFKLADTPFGVRDALFWVAPGRPDDIGLPHAAVDYPVWSLISWAVLPVVIAVVGTELARRRRVIA